MSDSAQQLIDNIAYKDESISLRDTSITAIDIGAATRDWMTFPTPEVAETQIGRKLFRPKSPANNGSTGH